MKKIIIMLILPLFFIGCHLLSDPFEENINTFSRISRYNIVTHETEILDEMRYCHEIQKLNNSDRYIYIHDYNIYLTDCKFKDKKKLCKINVLYWDEFRDFILSPNDIIYFISEKGDFVILNPYTEEYSSLFVGDVLEFDAATDDSEALFVKKTDNKYGIESLNLTDNSLKKVYVSDSSYIESAVFGPNNEIYFTETGILRILPQNSSEPIDTGLRMGRKIGRSPDSRYIVSRKGTSVYNTVDGSVMNFNNFKGSFFNFCSEHRFTTILINQPNMFYTQGDVYMYDIKTGESSIILHALHFCQTGIPDEVIKINTVEED